jgi:hypothetical protein
MNHVLWLAMIGEVQLHGQRQYCMYVNSSLFIYLLFISYPHLIDKLIIMNAPHMGAYRANLSITQLRRSWFPFFFEDLLFHIYKCFPFLGTCSSIKYHLFLNYYFKQMISKL